MPDLSPLFWLGASVPTKIDDILKKSGTLILTSLLEDLVFAWAVAELLVLLHAQISFFASDSNDT